MPNAAGYEIYILRHGIASERGHGTPSDFQRKLTDEGKEKIRRVARGLLRLGVQPDWIVTSPLVRARETADTVAQQFEDTIRLDVFDGLKPGESAEALLRFLATQRNRRRIVVVGHEPGLSELAERLLGARSGAFILKKGGCCCIRVQTLSPDARGQLLWWLTPRVLKSIRSLP